MKLYSQSQRGRVAARILSLSALVVGGGLILTGCPTGATLEDSDQFLNGSSSSGGDGDEPACDALPIFEQGCAGSICHGDDSGDLPSGGVDLINPGVAARLLDIDATYPGVSGCPDIPEKLVDSTSLEASLLWTKLNNTQICGDGMPIPHSAVALPESDMECVRSWMQDIITNGAGAAPPGGGGASGDGDGDVSATGGADGSGGTPSTGGTSAMGGTVRVEAECALGAGDCGGVTGSATAAVMLENGDTTVGFFSGGESLTYSGVVTDGQDTLTLQLAKGNMGGTVEIRLDSATGTLIGTHSPANTGDWTTFTPVEVALTQALTGSQTIVFVAADNMAGVLNLDWFELSTGAAN